MADTTQHSPFILNQKFYNFVPGRGEVTLEDMGGTQSAKLWWLIAGQLFVVLLVFGAMVIGSNTTTQQFWSNAMSVTGTVTNCQEVPRTGDRAAYTNVEVVFTEVDVREPMTVQAFYRLPARYTCNMVNSAEKVQMAYAKGNPRDARMADERFGQQFGYTDGGITQPLIIMVIPVLILVGVVVKAIRVTRNNRDIQDKREQLAQSGQIISGEVVKARMHSGGSREKGYVHFLTLDYRFNSPQTGAELKGRQRRWRDDLYKQPLPEAGHPVKVLYLDDTCYIVL